MRQSKTEEIYRSKRESAGFIYKILRAFTIIHPGEAPTAFLSIINIFLLLVAYYIIKPVREALILAGKGAGETSQKMGKIKKIQTR